MKIKPSTGAGFTLTEVMIVVGIIGLLAEIAIPNFIQARLNANIGVCINNLRQIDNAKQQWAIEELRSPTAVPSFSDISVFMWRGNTENSNLRCPMDPSNNYDNSYDTGDLMNLPRCRIRPDSHILVD